MGPSGSAKTTLLNCLSGLDEIDGGQVLVDPRLEVVVGDLALRAGISAPIVRRSASARSAPAGAGAGAAARSTSASVRTRGRAGGAGDLGADRGADGRLGASERLDRGDRVLRAGVDDELGAEPLGAGQPLGIDVHRDEPVRP